MTINIPINISLNQLWGGKAFIKSDWGCVNLIVGPNGTGKSLFADQLKSQLSQNFIPRLLNAERLSGLEKQDYIYFGRSGLTSGFDISQFSNLKSNGAGFGLSSSAFITLKERLDVRIKIEALLSDLFNKKIRLAEEGGYLKPKIQNNFGGLEYGLKESECHGLKELITLLTFLYDESNNCLILDEPELHLHPQFQSFLLSEIKKVAGNPNLDPTKKLIFIITHSPYFLDLKCIDDLKNILVCHYNQPPNFITSLDAQDEYVLRKFLPRFNTHHKQFFFSNIPVFVEGYTDQQLITLIFDKIDYNVNASGSCVIDVGGKDELAVFFRLCKRLNIKARIIADIDALFKGKLREDAQEDDRCNSFIQNEGLGTDLSTAIGELDRKLKNIANDIVNKSSADSDLIKLIAFLKPIISDAGKKHIVIISMLLALVKFEGKIKTIVSSEELKNVNYVILRFRLLLNAFKSADIFIFPNGEIEHYYKQTVVDYLDISDKVKNESFHKERDYLLSCDDKVEIKTKYADLISILEESVPLVKVSLNKHINLQIIEWLQTVQRIILKGGVTNIDELKMNAEIKYDIFNQIFEVVSLNVESDKKFACRIKLKKSISNIEKEIDFNHQTTPHNFNFED